jgi:hypothetical protein
MSHPNKYVRRNEANKGSRKLTEVNEQLELMLIVGTNVDCKYVDMSSILYSRTYLEFVNLNATSSVTMIGGVCQQLKDVL